jgi:hypothetical protein
MEERELKRLLRREVRRWRKFYGLKGWRIRWSVVRTLGHQNGPIHYASNDWITSDKICTIRFARDVLTSAKVIEETVEHELGHLKLAEALLAVGIDETESAEVVAVIEESLETFGQVLRRTRILSRRQHSLERRDSRSPSKIPKDNRTLQGEKS